MIEPIEKNVDFTNLSNVRRKYDVYELNGIKLTRSANEPVWEERYRPRKIYDLIMPSKVTKQLEEYKKQGDLKSLLLYSHKGGLGKEQPYSEPVLTSNGWATMGELKINDYVIDKSGKETKIIDIFEQGEKDVYEFQFIDGSKTRCGIDHLWEVVNIKKTKSDRTKEVKDTHFLINNLHLNRYDKRYDRHYKESKYAISMLSSPVQFNPKEVKIDPYALGLLLGDSCFRSQNPSFSNIDLEIKDKLESLIPESLTRYDETKGDYMFKSNNQITKQHLIDYGLWGHKSIEKFIPKDYLYNCIDVRTKLYQGLIDTDGHKLKDDALEYSTSSKQLAYDFLELARSLGYQASMGIKENPTYSYNNEKLIGQTSYRIFVNNKKLKTIVDIVKLDYKENSRCIKVDNEDELYVTSNYNVTHNTSVSQVMIHELGADFLTLSANIERGVAAIKEKVVPFAQNLSMFGDRKIVCIEEIGDAIPAQVDSLKSVLDRYASNVSIIITTNSMSNISQPLRTRFNIIDFNNIPSEDMQQMTIKTILRIKSILQIEGVEYTDDDIKYLFATYKFSFREIINTLQSSVIDGKLVLTRNAISSTSINELLKLINDKDFKRLAELSMGVNHSEFLEHLNNEYLNLLQDANHIPAIIMIMNTLQESLAKNVAFPNIAFMKACIDMINQKLMFKV